MVLERRAFRSEAGVDLIGQTYVKLARSFDPAKTQVRRRLPAGGGRIRTLGPPLEKSAQDRSRVGSVACSLVGVRFAEDSTLEEGGFELSVPRPR
jgi:hypothetical protein